MQELPSVTVIPGHGFPQCSIQGIRQAAACLMLALLCACERPDLPAPGPLPAQLQATSIQKLQRLHISQGECDGVLSLALHDHGFAIAGQTGADASIRLTLNNKRPLREHLPVIQTLGWQAHFRADIIGAEQKILLSFFGQEGSLSFRELCDDIGDEIAYKLKEYLPDREQTPSQSEK